MHLMTATKKTISALEIIKKSHHENVNSSIYSYFLDKANNEKVANVFLTTLLELVEIKKNKRIVIDNYKCVTEDLTKKNNRIDITLNDTSNESAIIIENKIFHHLDNDLFDYWEHFNYSDDNKLGILLTLEEHFIPDEAIDKFINIKHSEWIDKIKEIGLPSGIPHKLYIYLNDFFKTIDNLTKNFKMNEQASFYFEHSIKILKAVETVNEANKFINNQLETLASKLNLFTYGNSMDWRNLWDKEKDSKVYYTVILTNLLNGNNKIQVIIELLKPLKDREEELRELFKNNSQYNHSEMKYNTWSSKSQVHFAKRSYKLNSDQIKDFSNVVERIIKDDFETIMTEIINYISSSKNS
jgi:hypothetical protein